MKKIIFLTLIFFALNTSAQNSNAMVCKAYRDNTENTGVAYLPKPNEIIKDYYYFIVNIDTTKIKTFVPKFVYINCTECEGFNADHRYKLPLESNTTNKVNCDNSILDKNGSNVLLEAEREIYKQGENYNDKKYLEQKLDNKYEGYYHKYPAILEIEVNGKLEVLYCTLIDFIAKP